MKSELEDLRAGAESRRPWIEFPGRTRLEQMINGFLEARGYILKIIPPGSAINYDTAVAASSMLDRQILQNKRDVRSALESGDAAIREQAAPELSYEQSPHYWLAQYQIASEGIGAYASGEMERRVGTLNWMAQDYDRSIENRIAIFSQLVAAGRNGYMRAFITPEAYTQSAVAGSPKTATLLRSGGESTQVRKALVIGPAGTQVRFDMVDGKVGLGVEPITVLTIASAAVVVLIASAIVAGCVYHSLEKRRIETSAELARSICMKAADNNDKKLLSACVDLGDRLQTPTSVLEQFGGSKLQDYLIWGGVALAGIYLAPLIVDSLMATRSTIRQYTSKSG